MYQIGFTAHEEERSISNDSEVSAGVTATPRKSVVRIHFPTRNVTLSYYNDAFDLKRGDIVYVDGKLEGLRGRVVDITYTFKIKLSDYKRVIGVADTNVTGEFLFAGSHFVTVDRTALPYEKIVTWFKAPEKEDEVYVDGKDDVAFRLDNLGTMKISAEVAERGHEYFMENKVCYITLDGDRGRALVNGSRTYELEFEYHDGEIRNLTCDCFCSYPCKHEFAAMLQLRETLDWIEKHYARRYEESRFFAAVYKGALMSFAVEGKETGRLIL